MPAGWVHFKRKELTMLTVFFSFLSPFLIGITCLWKEQILSLQR